MCGEWFGEVHMADLEVIRDALRRSSPHDLNRLEQLIESLPPDERMVWRCVGECEPTWFDPPAILVDFSPETLQCLKSRLESKFALWPQVPPSEVETLPKGAESSLYYGNHGLFGSWADEFNQEILMDWARSSNPGCRWELLLDVAAGCERIILDFPQSDYESLMKSRSGASEALHLFLDRAAGVAQNIGWVAVQVGMEPAWLLILGSRKNPQLITNIEAAIAESRRGYVLISRDHDVVRWTAVSRPKWLNPEFWS